MSAQSIEMYVISHYENLQMDAEEIASVVALSVEQVQKIIDDHNCRLDAWLLSAQHEANIGEQYSEYDR